MRKSSKQCPFFTKTGTSYFRFIGDINSNSATVFLYVRSYLSLPTGTCARGKKCLYQHDPEKIAICPRFLHYDCPFTAETCQLSHDPTPNRTPLCIHFANSGRCKNGDKCLYPHFNVESRTGVCKDFAVLGFCDKGIDCDKQHLKECPGFAENGVCNIKNCKLPHVIRANATRRKKIPIPTPSDEESKVPKYGISFTTMAPEETLEVGDSEMGTGDEAPSADGDYIPLTFEESDDDDDEALLGSEEDASGSESLADDDS